MLNTRMRTRGSCALMRRISGRPPSPLSCIARSTMTTSGRWRRHSLYPVGGVARFEYASTPASSSMRRHPCSTMGWSSTMRTLVMPSPHPLRVDFAARILASASGRSLGRRCRCRLRYRSYSGRPSLRRAPACRACRSPRPCRDRSRSRRRPQSAQAVLRFIGCVSTTVTCCAWAWRTALVRLSWMQR